MKLKQMKQILNKLTPNAVRGIIFDMRIMCTWSKSLRSSWSWLLIRRLMIVYKRLIISNFWFSTIHWLAHNLTYELPDRCFSSIAWDVRLQKHGIGSLIFLRTEVSLTFLSCGLSAVFKSGPQLFGTIVTLLLYGNVVLNTAQLKVLSQNWYNNFKILISNFNFRSIFRLLAENWVILN